MLYAKSYARCVRAAILLGVAALPGTAHAATYLWNGSVGSYTTPANWGGVVPGIADTAIINAGRADIISGNNFTGTLNIGSNGNLRLNGAGALLTTNTLVNNGNIDLMAGTFRPQNGVAMNVSGTGTIMLGSAASATLFQSNNAKNTLGAGQTVSGTGRILNNQGLLNNQGTIRSSAGTGITIDPQGTSVGFTGTGVGTNGSAGMYNSGSLIAGGAAMTLAAGLYENSKDGMFAADGADFTMQYTSALTNLTGITLSKGNYSARAGTLTLRGDSLAALSVIGNNGITTDTVVSMSGTTSQIIAIGDLGTTPLEQTLQAVYSSARLEVLDGRSATFTRNIFNFGIIQLGGTAAQADSSFTALAFASAGTVVGHGSVQTSVTNSISGLDGMVRANNGTLTLAGLTGGTAQSDVGATLNLAAGVTTPNLLINNGAIVIGNNVIAVTTDYQNAAFGSGNAFNARANVTGTGAINAVSATQALSATGLSGTTLDLGVQRVGATTRTLTITNNGTLTTLRGAVQNANAPGVGVTGADFVLAANGGTANAVLSYGTVSGDFAGQSLTVANNFDNVADATLMLTGKVTQVSIAALFKAAGLGTLTATGANSYTLDLGSFAAGRQTITTDFGVLNDIALTTFSENLGGAFGGAGGPFSLTGGSFAGVDGGMSYNGARLSFATSGLVAGDYASTLLLDTFSRFTGLGDLALSRTNITVTARITGTAPTAVPEPRLWAQLFAGFAMIGWTTRRRRRPVIASR